MEERPHLCRPVSHNRAADLSLAAASGQPHSKTRGKQLRLLCGIAALALSLTPAPLVAGPPYLTDDPIPTETGHWEIFAFTAGEGHSSTIDDDVGLDLNYGAFQRVQLTATLPISFAHAPGDGWRSSTGDVELGLKYRVLHDAGSGLSAAVFPRAILPTATHSRGGNMQFLLPVWVGKDFAGGISVFGGGGYQINRGAGKRDFWQGGIAVTGNLRSDISVGAELTRQGPDVDQASAQTRAGIGSTIQLSGHSSLLFSGGPTWADHHTAYHFYAALGLNY